jgi:hypothetical protein
MKKINLIIMMNLAASLAFGLVARAERCSIEGHEQELRDFYENSMRKSLSTLPKKAGFAMNPDTLEIKISNTDVSDDAYLPLPELRIEGNFQSEKGTDFDILVHSADVWITLNGEYTELQTSEGDVLFTPTLLSKGKDREGNPISPRCSLSTSAWFTIRNKKTGTILTRFELPSKMILNTSENK